MSMLKWRCFSAQIKCWKLKYAEPTKKCAETLMRRTPAVCLAFEFVEARHCKMSQGILSMQVTPRPPLERKTHPLTAVRHKIFEQVTSACDDTIMSCWWLEASHPAESVRTAFETFSMWMSSLKTKLLATAERDGGFFALFCCQMQIMLPFGRPIPSTNETVNQAMASLVRQGLRPVVNVSPALAERYGQFTRLVLSMKHLALLVQAKNRRAPFWMFSYKPAEQIHSPVRTTDSR